jgi:hypothetical protein
MNSQRVFLQATDRKRETARFQKKRRGKSGTTPYPEGTFERRCTIDSYAQQERAVDHGAKKSKAKGKRRAAKGKKAVVEASMSAASTACWVARATDDALNKAVATAVVRKRWRDAVEAVIQRRAEADGVMVSVVVLTDKAVDTPHEADGLTDMSPEAGRHDEGKGACCRAGGQPQGAGVDVKRRRRKFLASAASALMLGALFVIRRRP